ncbi:MAG: hypothetical protein ACKOYM_02875, partial [Actinomycetes bacterium]
MTEPAAADRPELRLVSAEDSALPDPPDGVEPTSGAGAGPGSEPVPASGDAPVGGDVTTFAGSADQPSDAPVASRSESASVAADASVADEPPEVTAAREVLAAVDAAGFHRSMSKLVRSSHNSILGPLPYAETWPFHDPNTVAVDPEPAGVDTVELYCRAAYPDFDQVLLRAFNDPAVDPVLTEVFHLLTAEDANIAIVTNHGQIIDIALVIGAFTSAMCRAGRSFGVLGESIDPADLVDRNNVVVSRMVATRQAFGLPAVQLLQSGTRVFFSVPQTQSRRRAKLDPEQVRANNVVMRHELDERMSTGGQVLAMAASGSQDISAAAGLARKARVAWRQRRGEEPPESATLHLQPLYNGTINLMLGC